MSVSVRQAHITRDAPDGRGAGTKADPDGSRSGLRVSWDTANDKAKQGLPEPPRRDHFEDQEEYEEAQSSWRHFVYPVLALRHGKAPPKHTP